MSKRTPDLTNETQLSKVLRARGLSSLEYQELMEEYAKKHGVTAPNRSHVSLAINGKINLTLERLKVFAYSLSLAVGAIIDEDWEKIHTNIDEQ